MCMLVTVGNKIAARKALLSELPFPKDPFLLNLPYLLAYFNGGVGEEEEGEVRVVVKNRREA